MTTERRGGIDENIFRLLLELGVKQSQAIHLATQLKDFPVPPEFFGADEESRRAFFQILAFVPTDESGQRVISTEGFENAQLSEGQDIIDFVPWMMSNLGQQWLRQVALEFTGSLPPRDPRDAPNFNSLSATEQDAAIGDFDRRTALLSTGNVLSTEQTQLNRIAVNSAQINAQQTQVGQPPIDPRTQPGFSEQEPNVQRVQLDNFFTAQDAFERDRQQTLQEGLLTAQEAGQPSGEARARQLQAGPALTGDFNQRLVQRLQQVTEAGQDPTGTRGFFGVFNEVLESLSPEERQLFQDEVDAEAEAEESETRQFESFRAAGGRLSREQFIAEGRPAGPPTPFNVSFERALSSRDLSINQLEFARRNISRTLSGIQAGLPEGLSEFGRATAQSQAVGSFDFLEDFRKASRRQRGEFPRTFRPPTRTLRH